MFLVTWMVASDSCDIVNYVDIIIDCLVRMSTDLSISGRPGLLSRQDLSFLGNGGALSSRLADDRSRSSVRRRVSIVSLVGF